MELFQDKKVDFIGHKEQSNRLIRMAKSDHLKTIIWGPPGVGKTTFSKHIAKELNLSLIHFTPSVQTLVDLKKVISENKYHQFILFVDEVHRLDRKQQDFFLTILEESWFHFIGATTEEPFRFLTPAMNSRLTLTNSKNWIAGIKRDNHA